jgi:hypothetical protein
MSAPTPASASTTASAAGRLSHLLQLADQGPSLRTALAEEVAELLIHWPHDCPHNMRGVCETLLARCARDVDDAARARLRVLLHADPALCGRVLPRQTPDRLLVETARAGGDVGAALAEALAVDVAMAHHILHDPSGEQLVIACKAAGIDRAAFSALALTLGPRREPAATYALLDSFDAISPDEARGRLHAWQAPPRRQERQSA